MPAILNLRKLLNEYMTAVHEADVPDDLGAQDNARAYAGADARLQLGRYRWCRYLGVADHVSPGSPEVNDAIRTDRGIGGLGRRIELAMKPVMGELIRSGWRRDDVNTFQRGILRWATDGARLLHPNGLPVRPNDSAAPIDPAALGEWTNRGARLAGELSNQLQESASDSAQAVPPPQTRRPAPESHARALSLYREVMGRYPDLTKQAAVYAHAKQLAQVAGVSLPRKDTWLRYARAAAKATGQGV